MNLDSGSADSEVASSSSSECAPLAAAPRVAVTRLRGEAKFEVTALYVKIASGDAEIDRNVNATLDDEIRQRQARFVTAGDDLLESAKENGSPLPLSRIDDEIQCSPALTTPRLLGVSCVETSFMDSAHLSKDHFTFNFALCKGRGASVLSLESLCTDVAVCRKRMTDRLWRSVAEAGASFDGPPEDYHELFRRFVIVKHGLRFFVADDLAHVFNAIPPVDVPFAELTDVLRRDGPLAGLL